MKLSIFPQYGALNSRPVFAAFVTGSRKLGHTVVENSLDADCYVIWSVLWHGRMKNNQEIWKLAKKSGKKIIILEVGGLNRGLTWRVGLNHINANGIFWTEETFDQIRPQKLGVSLQNREKSGKNILICGQHRFSEQWTARPNAEIWLSKLINDIKKYSDRKIVFRPHPRDFQWAKSILNLGIDIHLPGKIANTYDDFDHHKDFQEAWCVFNPCSNTGIQAAIAGIPIFCDQDSLAYPVSNKNLELIENAQVFDRNDWLIKLCHTEWTLQEIEEGLPQSRIL